MSWNVFAREPAAPDPTAKDSPRADRLERLQAALGGQAQRAALAELLREEESRRIYAPGVPADYLAHCEGRKEVLRDLIADLNTPIQRS